MSIMRLKLITFGLGNVLKPELIKTVVNHGVKPKGGLWASPIYSPYGWKQWCEDEHRGDLSTSFTFDFYGNVFVIDNEEDLHKMKWFKKSGIIDCPDFEALRADGYDAVFLTEKGQSDTRFSEPYNLYGWDCECVLIMNAACVS